MRARTVGRGLRRIIAGFITIALVATPWSLASPAQAATGWATVGSAINGTATDDQLGYSVAVSSDGRTIVAGAPFSDDSALNAGKVRVLAFDTATLSWQPMGPAILGAASDDEFGYAVALSRDGRTMAAGAAGVDGSATNAGQVRIFTWHDGGATWTPLGGAIDGEAADDYSGRAVALSSDGRTVAIGASANDGAGVNAGQVRVFAFDDTSSSWTQLGSDIDGEAAADGFGSSVAISEDGRTVVIGAPYNDGAGGNAGRVRVFAFDGAAWIQLGSDIDGEAAGDRFGSSVAVSDDGLTIAAGAPDSAGDGLSNQGQVRVFTFGAMSWTQVGASLYGDDTESKVGFSVSLARDGGIVAFGAPSFARPGAQGQVSAHAWSGAAWAPLGGSISGGAAQDSWGFSVAWASDASVVAAGAPGGDPAGISSGYVRAYTVPTSAPTGLSATAGAQQLSISFTPGATGGSPITGYEYALESPPGSGFAVWTAAGTASSPVTITGLTGGATYGVKLRALTAFGPGAESASVTGTPDSPPAPPPPPLFPPSAPLDVVGVPREGSATITWSPPNSTGSFALTQYQVTTTPEGHGCIVTAAETACRLTGLTNGTIYTATVRALNGAGWGPDSAPSPAFTPSAPTVPTITISGTRADVRGRPGITVTGTSTDLEPGTVLRPWFRFPGQTSYTEGGASILVSDQGTFTWQRRTGKKIYITVRSTDGGASSNRLVIDRQEPPRRR